MAAAPRGRWVRLTGQRSIRCATRSTGGEQGAAGWARVSLPGDVNELSVDERSVASCRLPTSLKHEGATVLSFSPQ